MLEEASLRSLLRGKFEQRTNCSHRLLSLDSSRLHLLREFNKEFWELFKSFELLITGGF